jgi:hypothetical protein
MKNFWLTCLAGLVVILALVLLGGAFHPASFAGHVWFSLMSGNGSDAVYFLGALVPCAFACLIGAAFSEE